MSAPVDAVVMASAVMASAVPKERSIQFNGEMVRAVLDGRKTQTRRPINPQPGPGAEIDVFEDRFACYGLMADIPNGLRLPFECPYGRVGDRLRISEDVEVSAINWGRYRCKYAADNSVVTRKASPDLYAKIRSYKRPRLRGVHLPAEYARDVRLEITGVRVERLNEISDVDAISEGVLSIPKSVHGPLEQTGRPPLGPSPRMQFATLWESINGPDSWVANPWVWVVEFKRLG